MIMAYALTRAGKYITKKLPPTISGSVKAAWKTDSIDEAIERQQLLQMAFGISTDIRST